MPNKPRSFVTVPRVVWALGDKEQSTISGVTVETRAIYYRPKGAPHHIRVGSIHPDYAEPLMEALSKGESSI